MATALSMAVTILGSSPPALSTDGSENTWGPICSSMPAPARAAKDDARTASPMTAKIRALMLPSLTHGPIDSLAHYTLCCAGEKKDLGRVPRRRPVGRG